MNIFIFIASAIVLYPVLGTIFGILLTVYNSNNLKLKILLLTILRPLIYTSILGLTFSSIFNGSLIWFIGFFIAVILRDMIFSSQNFLSKLELVNDNILAIEFIDSVFRRKHIEIVLDNEKHIDLSGMKSLTEYPPSLKCIENDKKSSFIILSQQTWREASQTLSAANTGILQKLGLTEAQSAVNH